MKKGNHNARHLARADGESEYAITVETDCALYQGSPDLLIGHRRDALFTYRYDADLSARRCTPPSKRGRWGRWASVFHPGSGFRILL